MKKAYLIIPATIILLAIVFLLFELSKPQSPCDIIFQQTATKLTANLKILGQTANVGIEDQQIQKLSDDAQVVAENLKTCCIMRTNNKLSDSGFFICQQIGNQYRSQVDDLAKHVNAVDQAKQKGDSSEINQIFAAIKMQFKNLQQSSDAISQNSSELKKNHYDDFIQASTGKIPIVNIPPSPTRISTEGKINLIDSKMGGQILVVPDSSWAKTIDGSEEDFRISCCEGIYGFKDGRKAVFDMFCILITSTGDNNIKDFELSYGNDTEIGKFDSIPGKFQTQNALMTSMRYQEFHFKPVSAKFFKIKILANWGQGVISTREFQLFGSLK